MSQMRMGFYSNGPTTPSGYGTVTLNVVSRLRALGYDITVIDNCGSITSPMRWKSPINGATIPILPGGGGLCESETYGHYKKGSFDWLLVLYDGLNFANFVQYCQQDRDFRVIAHTPFDHD